MSQFNIDGNKLKIIKQGDPDFLITDGMIMTPRAEFDISHNCPSEYKKILITCLDNGWISPVAYIKESNFMWEKLQ